MGTEKTIVTTYSKYKYSLTGWLAGKIEMLNIFKDL